MQIPEVVAELKEIRRGRGVRADDIHLRIGDALRAACGITDADNPAVVRRKLILRIGRLSAKLPADLHLAADVALGLHPKAEGKFLDERISWLADVFDRDPRTARRRVDSAFTLLGELLYDTGLRQRRSGAYSPDGWYVQSLRSVLRMDLDPPTLTEERRIVAAVDELDELVLSFSSPNGQGGGSPTIHAEIDYGGEIVGVEPVSPSHSRFVVRLPAPLSLGEHHDYAVRFTSYPRELMRPYYVLTPLRRCDEFSARVRFAPDSRPAEIWRVNGLPPKAYEDFLPGSDTLELDRVGEVVVEFHDLQPGLSYGMQWSVDRSG